MVPAYAGLLGSMGLAFLLQTVYLLPITVAALVVVVGALGFRATRRRGFAPFVLGILAASLLLVGKFVLEFDLATYGGIGLLVVASVWNSWPIKVAKSETVQLELPESARPNHLTSKENETMTTRRTVEVFSAGCPACDDAITMIKDIACPSCDVSVLDMNDPSVAGRAKGLGIRSVPAVVIDGKLADCCAGRGPDEATLRAAGLGQPIS